MEGAATFLRLPQLAAKLDEVPDSAELHVDFEHLSHIDHACLDLLMDWAKQHEGMGGKLVIDWSSLHGRFYEDPKEGLELIRQVRRLDEWIPVVVMTAFGSVDVAVRAMREGAGDFRSGHR